MCGHQPIRKYIINIKNGDIRDIHRSISTRYINIEDTKKVKSKLNKNNDNSTLQRESEYNRENFNKKMIFLKF